MAQEVNTDKKPPYISFVTFKNFLEGLQKAVIPARIDKGLMSGMSGGTQTYLLATLRYLALTDQNGIPSDDLEAVVKWDKSAWDKVVRRSYQFIFGSDVDLKTGTEMQVLELFETQGVTGDTRRKCLSFFSAVCERAGIELGPHIKGRSSTAATGNGRKKGRKQRRAENSEGGGGESGSLIPPIAGHNEAVLPLTSDGSRMVKLTAPATVTKAELNRIQQWLGFQLIVSDE